MNPATEPPPVQPPRSSFSCDRHPDENFTGFCPSCLCERLTVLDHQSANAAVASSSSRRNSTSSSTATATATAAVIRSIFKAPAAATRNSLFPELRRTKSFSAGKHEGLEISAGGYEPQRKSCDVRGRNTLSSLFSIHDENKPQAVGNNAVVVLETNREDEEDEEEDEVEEECHVAAQFDENEEDDEIRVLEEPEAKIVNELNEIRVSNELDLKPMKEHIDLDSQSKKSTRSNFWSAASVLTKKWHKWRTKQKPHVTGTNGVILPSKLPVEKPISRQFRETQSEIADYGYGRRSCDTDPRFSLDVGRVSFDDPRYSFDEPRASWDGYLIGRTFPRLPPMVEDVPVVPIVPRCDSQIPVEDNINIINIPGGSVQTREYYLDSSSKRRKSLDRSNSVKRMAAELDETKALNPNPNLIPNPIDPPRVSNSSLRDDSSETFELGFKDRDNVVPRDTKKPRKWRWKIWGLGFINRRSKDDEEDVGRCYSESWRDCGNEVNTNNNNNNINVNPKVLRSNSSVSWRSSSMRKSNPSNNMNRKNRRTGDESVLERNRSARYSYSPNHVDNGLLRFYLGPLSGSRRSGKARGASNAHSITRSMLGLY